MHVRKGLILIEEFAADTPVDAAGERHCGRKGKEVEGDNVHHGLARVGSACR
jgi:hypothetical protein